MTLTRSVVRSPARDVVRGLTELAGGISGPSISLSAPDFGGSTYYVGVDEDDITVTINNATDGENWNLTISSSGGGTDVTDSGVVSGSTVNAGAQDLTGLNAGTLTFSYEEASVEVATKVRTLAATAAPDAPVIVATPSTSGAAQNVITWARPAQNGSAITGYTLTVDDGSGFSALATPGAGDTSYTHSNLIIGKEYTYRLTATNSVGTGSNSNEPAGTPAGVVHVFLLAGQSNMLGRPLYDSLGDYPSNAYDWTGSDYQLATSPLTNAGAGDMGLTITFVEDYLAANTDVDAVALVQMAVGGTGFNTSFGNNWNKGDTEYEAAIVEFNQALSDYDTHTLAGFLWHQGERDEAAMTDSEYEIAQDQMISDMRSDVTAASSSTPFVVGEISTDYSSTRRASISDTVNRVAYTGAASSAALTTYDSVHFNAASLRTLGSLYEDAFANALVNVPGVAGAPTNLSATPGTNQAVLTWDAPANTGLQSITDYTVQYSSDGGSNWSTFSDGVSASTGATVTGLTQNTTYTFRVAAVNASGTGSYSDTDTALVQPSLPAQVGTVTPTGGNAEVSLSWSAPSANGATITDYLVQYSSDSGSNWTTFADGTSATTSATVTGLTNGTEYVFRVAAVNSIGTGSYSAASSAVTPADGVTRADVVTIVNATDGSLWDFTDTATLWQDTGGTSAVTTDGQNLLRADDLSSQGRNMTKPGSYTNNAVYEASSSPAYADLAVNAPASLEFPVDTAWTDATVMIALRFPTGEDRTILFGEENSGSGGYFGYIRNGSTSTVLDNASGTPTYHVDGSAFAGTTRDQLWDEFTADTWHVFEIRALDLSGYTQPNIVIGADNPASVNHFAGNIAAAVFMQAPSTAQRDDAREWLADLVGVTLP